MIFIQIKEGEITNPGAIRKAAKDMKDGYYEWNPKRRNKRSNAQNRYWHGCVVPLVREGLVNNGYEDVRSNEIAHEILKKLFLETTITNGIEEIKIPGSTARLSKIEFMELIDRVAKWTSEYLGFPLPMPNQQTNIFEQ